MRLRATVLKLWRWDEWKPNKVENSRRQFGETFEDTEKKMSFYFSFPFLLFQSSLLLLFFYFMSVGVVCVAIYRKGEGMGKFAVNTMSSFLNISMGYLVTSEYSWIFPWDIWQHLNILGEQSQKWKLPETNQRFCKKNHLYQRSQIGSTNFTSLTQIWVWQCRKTHFL